MNTLTIFRTLGPVDLKNVRREAGLAWFLILPLVMALVLRLGVPAVAEMIDAYWAFDLAPYYPLVASGFLLMAPAVVGMVVGFLLLDERDDHVLTALLVTPVPLNGYVLYRLSMPMLLGMATTLLCYPLIGLAPLALRDLLVVAALGSFTSPLIALCLATFAQNKVAGFALIKLLNAVEMIPIVAFFVDSPWQLLVGIIPTYWPLKVFWQAAAGQPYMIYLVVGVIVNLLALWALLRRFKIVVHR